MISVRISRHLFNLLVASTVVFAVRAEPAADLASAQPAVELLLPGPPGFHYAGYYAAEWRGFFAEEGVNVRLRHAHDPDSIVEAVLKRPAVYGVGSENFLLARLEGRPVVMIAAVLQETSQALALARSVNSLEALRNRRVALLPGVRSAPLQMMLRRAGVGPLEATWLAPWDARAGEANGGFDAWQVDIRDGDLTALRPADHGVLMFYGDSLFTTEAELAYHPQRVRAIHRAVLRGWDYALKNVASTIAAMEAQRSELSLVHTADQLAYEAELVRGLAKPSMVPLGSVQRVRVHEMAEALVELGLAPRVEFLDNFIYSPPTPWLPRWIYWVGGGLAVAALGGLVVAVFNVRLQRRVLERTQELRRSEERAREMFEHAPVAIVEEDFSSICAWLDERRHEGVSDIEAWLDAQPETLRQLFHHIRVVLANDVALRLIGASDVAEYQRYLVRDLNDSVLAAFREQVLALWRGERELAMDVVFVHRDGGEGFGLLQWTVPLIDGTPDFQRVLLVLTDITLLRRAEARVRESEARFRTLFESAIEGVYESTPQDGIIVGNPALARIFACESPTQMLAWCRRTGVENIYVNPGRRREFLAKIGQRDVVLDFESEVFCADGTRKWISENVRAIRGPTGELIGTQGFVSDISERKRFEQALAEERERLAVTLRAMTEAVITTDRAGIVQFINEAAEHLTGWAEGAAIGKPLVEVCVLRHERTRAPVTVPFEAAMRGETVVDLPRATQLVDRQDVPRLVEGRCAPVHDMDSRPVGMVLVLRDVAERSRLEAEMVRNSKLESLGVLAGGIAHDFNNLLTVILGNVTLAQLDGSLAKTAGRWLKDAELASVRARELTRQLLTFAKGGDPVRTAVRLAEVVREAADFALHGSRVRCEFTLSSDMWSADVDKGQIGQVVQNLVINAVQAMPDGGVVRITLVNQSHLGDAVRAIKPGPYLRLEIVDEGSGIRPEHLTRIFDPYFTTKTTGSGLGLAMVYSIVKKHDGHIEVDSEVGRGTTFRILLPALPSAAPLAAAAPEERTVSLSGRVLFMDDQESICRMATALLERIGFSVTAVRDGTEVLREYTAAREAGQPYDVVLMDLTVPGGMGGREAMETLRRLDPSVRAVVSSGYSSDPVLANHRAYGFRGRVAKPYRASDLAKALREVLAEESDAAHVS
jgi:PAS domain S-box-containing protein